MPSRPTVTSLAEKLGVSRQTISNALNNPQRVHPQTLERVLAEVKASGYVASRAAQQLRTQRANAIGFRLYPTYDGINGNILDRFLHALTIEAQDRGFTIAVFSAESAEQEVETLLNMREAGLIDAAILAASTPDDPRFDALTEGKLDAICFGRPWGREDSPVPWVDVDGQAGTKEVAEYLRSRGHVNIGWIGWDPEAGVGRDRADGFKAGMEEFYRADLTIRCRDDAEAGMRAAKTLRDKGATALVCASDTLALGAHAANVFNPADLFGFDNTPVSRALALNSVEQPVEEVASTCLNNIIQMLTTSTPIENTVLPAKAVIRS